MRRWLLRIGGVLGLWAFAATAYVNFRASLFPQVRPPSVALTELRNKKADRSREVIDAAGAGAVACIGLAALMGLGKRLLAPESMARSDGANAPPGAGLSAPPPATEEGPDEPPHETRSSP